MIIGHMRFANARVWRAWGAEGRQSVRHAAPPTNNEDGTQIRRRTAPDVTPAS